MIKFIPGRRPSRPPGAGLLVVLLALMLAGASCSSPGPPACPDESHPALQLEVVDEAGEPLIGAALRYRVDQGQWQEWPEHTGLNTVIRGGPGEYQVEVSLQGFEGATTTLDVPAGAEDACRAISQTARLELVRTLCPEPPAVLTLTVDPPVDELQASVTLPDSGRQRLACQEASGDFCREFSFEVTEPGMYALTLQDLPGLGAMLVVSNVVAYDQAPVALRLEHRGRSGTAEVSGVEAAELRFPVRRDEANCPLADLSALETVYPQDEVGADPGGRPPLALHYQGGLLMTDLGADACQAKPVLTALPFSADLPAGTNLAGVEVQVDYGEGWQTAQCQFSDGRYLCQVPVPNPLLNRPFVARVLANDEEAIGLSLPFGGLCLVFQ
jgi:hypothetical protein